MRQRLTTPSKITAWLDCPHYLTLRNKVDDGALSEPDAIFGSFARLLQHKGEVHEQDCLEDYKRDGKSIYMVPPRRDKETFAAWVERVANPLTGDWDIIYQMPFIHDGVRGIADFLERVEQPDGGFSYEPVDAKLTRVEAKPGHVLQLCFYAEAIGALSHVDPQRMHLLLGSKQRETLRTNEFLPYWRRLRRQISAAVEAGPDSSTAPEKCPHCQFCEFFSLCEAQWRNDDSLIFIPGIRQSERAALNIGGVTRLTQLGELQSDVAGIRKARLNWLTKQAALQVEAKLAAEAPVPFSVIEPGDDPKLGRGLEWLPRPDHGDVFLDFEGHPFWRADTGLFFLFGLIERDDMGTWVYRHWWAHDQEEEDVAVSELIGYLVDRRSLFPDMHAYHYNHTELSALQSLTRKHGSGEADLGRLVQAKFFIDLFEVARNSIQLGAESYSLKCLERLTDYERGHVIDKGAGAVVSYEKFMSEADQVQLDAIAAYNRDDVFATRALRDWLVAQRSADMPWRVPPEGPSEILVDIDDQIAAFHQFDEDTPEHLLGDLLGYWTNEWWAYLMPKLAQCQQDAADLLDTRDAITELQPDGLHPRFGKKGQELKNPAMRFRFPPQQLDGFPDGDEDVLYLLPDGSQRVSTIDHLDREGGLLDLEWREANQEAGYLPATVVLHTWVGTEVKRLALSDFASQLLEGESRNPVTEAILRGELPRFHPPHGPSGGVFADDVDHMVEWATHLDHSFVAVQGPPGTGKTYRAAHIVHALVASGQRVGITAFSHRAIVNLLLKVVEVFKAKGDLGKLRGVRVSANASPSLDGFQYGNAEAAARPEVNIVAGTTWLFSNRRMRDAPVDVLLIDEAGQLALADALSASTAAHNVILLGDPLQLPQVTQAVHAGGGGRSALEHILGQDKTLPSDRGVFIAQTRRMHPDVCGFISKEIYEGKLSSHKNCENQTTVAGTGLRWLKARHEGNSTSSIQEAELIAYEIGRLIGTPWTNFDSQENPLGVDDFMVVAPYNDQVRTIRKLLNADSRTAGIPVGTVDKFQGGEAAVIFFSMATSSGSDIVRGAEFLFSRNRLNVAISRARCLAYLVCTEDLLSTRARSVEEMRLIATLNAFVEWATG